MNGDGDTVFVQQRVREPSGRPAPAPTVPDTVSRAEKSAARLTRMLYSAGQIHSSKIKVTGVKSSFARLLLVAAAASFSIPSFAATPVETAQGMLTAGDLQGALKTLDKYLATAPQDAEARFTRGLVQVKLNKTEDALKSFSDLTRDYPQLPEPYNNLAVLYAQQGDYEKARDALEAALATHPAYATAHENLGDIYSALAGAAYNRALMLDKENPGLKFKLDLVNQLDTGLTAAPIKSAPVKSTPAMTAAATPAAPVNVTKPATAPAIAAPAIPMQAPAAAAKAADTSSEPLPAGVAAAVNGWAKAWSSKDIASYLGYYAADFKPEGGLTRGAWEQQRRERVTRPAHIDVRVVGLAAAKGTDGTLRVSFTQVYKSEAFSDQVSKVLEMKDAGAGYKITREFLR